MDERSLTALQKSIRHWERNAAGSFDGIGTYACALCELFYSDLCFDCPVYEKTGQSACVGTPLTGVNEAFEIHGPQSDEFRAAAQKEIDFLKSLLPK
jgi:hypothetical protein